MQQIDRVVEVVEETLKGHTVQLLGHKRTEDGRKAGGARLSLPKIRKNRLVEIIPINTGCLNQCTYCKTVHARGSLGAFSVILLEKKHDYFSTILTRNLHVASRPPLPSSNCTHFVRGKARFRPSLILF